MSSDSLIQEALSQFIMLRSPRELLHEFKTQALNLEQIRQLVQVFDPNIPNEDIKYFYLKVITKFKSPAGITEDIYQQIVDDEEFTLRGGSSNSYESLPLLKNIIRGVREKKVPIQRLYNFYDKNKDKELQDPEFRNLLEFFYVAITDAQFKKLREEFPDTPLSESAIVSLFEKWQEIVFENTQGDPQIILEAPSKTQNLLTIPKPQQTISLELTREEDERFKDFMGVDFKIPGVKELADLQKRCQQTQEIFTDPDFPPNAASLGPKFSANNWKRLQELFQGEQKVFSIDTQHDKSGAGLNKWISHRDICQGDLGDCYFMSTLSSIACKWPDQIKDLFPIQRANKFGVYGVKMCINGEWKVIPIDDNIPVKNGKIAFTKNADKEIWVSLLEKAWAKVNGSYTNIDAGDPREVIKTITGGPVWLLLTNKPNFKDNFITCVKQKCVMVTGTYSKNADYSAIGLEPGHAYSILNVKTINHPQRGQVHLLKIRNPWARKEWKGDWSDDSDLWTPQIREQAGNTGTENDGIFFMSLDDYTKYFFSVFCGYFKTDYIYNSMRFSVRRNKGVYFEFEIKKEGEYFFAIHQESTRQYRSQPELKYEYSYVRLLLAKELQNGYEYIEGKFYKDIETHVGRVGENFTPGKYILYIKIKWHVPSWNEHSVVLSTYGEQYVQLKEVPRDPNLVSQTMMHQVRYNNKVEEVLPGITMKMDNNGNLGIGYIYYKNESNQQVNFETNLVNKGGCKLTKPERGYYFKSFIPPKGERLVTFTITPPITELSMPTLSHKLL
ncbi:unnamed protein product [Paramecium octaurelia]|uniref:Calpain catalytic domain-containing protein n=1 Tax=Paramecium octaurelia TaxID=43137 RepID=A0A8S1T428_PAROT|nr:unnamed protein product [Paramecium octaurelia]